MATSSELAAVSSPERARLDALRQRLAARRELAGFLGLFERTVARRLARFWRPVTLFTYEGTMLDRLALRLLERCRAPGDYSVVCSVRPCMLPALIHEVRSFASRHGYEVVGFDGDCPARFPWEKEAPRSCEAIGREIYRRLRSTRGLLVSSAPLNQDTYDGFAEVNTEHDGGLYLFESPEIARRRQRGDGRDWRTLFLFQGFTADDLFLAYLRYLSTDLELHHLPLCYQDCYHEQEQRRLIELLGLRSEWEDQDPLGWPKEKSALPEGGRPKESLKSA